MKYRILDLLLATAIASLVLVFVTESRALRAELRWHEMQLKRRHEDIHDNYQEFREYRDRDMLRWQQLNAIEAARDAARGDSKPGE